MFYVVIIHTVHTIWLVLNALRYSSETFSLHGAKEKILSSVDLSSNLSSGKCLPIAFDSHMLEAFMASPHQINFSAIVTAHGRRQPCLM